MRHALRSRRTRRALPHRTSVPRGLGEEGHGFCSVVRRRRGSRARPARCKGAGNADRHHRRAPGARGHGSQCAHVTRRARGQPCAARGRDRAAAFVLERDGGVGLAGHPPARGARWSRCRLDRARRRARRARSPGGTGPVPPDGARLGRDRAVRQRRAARPLLPGLADGSVVAALGLGGSLSLSGGVLDGDGGVRPGWCGGGPAGAARRRRPRRGPAGRRGRHRSAGRRTSTPRADRPP